MSSSLIKTFEKALKFDSWGQRLEAADQYDKLQQEYNDHIKGHISNKSVKNKLEEIMEEASERSEMLTTQCLNLTITGKTSLEQMRSNFEAFKDAINKCEVDQDNKADFDPNDGTGASLLPAVKDRVDGMSYLTIRIDKVGLKDPQDYIDPFFRVSVRDPYGCEIGQPQVTPVSKLVEGSYVMFNCCVHIQEALENLPDGFAIFFLFNHYKDKKSRNSIKCFAFIENDEIKPGPATVELYKKPVDFKRKRLYLLTAKPLFLHLDYKIQQDS